MVLLPGKPLRIYCIILYFYLDKKQFEKSLQLNLELCMTNISQVMHANVLLSGTKVLRFTVSILCYILTTAENSNGTLLK